MRDIRFPFAGLAVKAEFLDTPTANTVLAPLPSHHRRRLHDRAGAHAR
jgi:hypothetical protein